MALLLRRAAVARAPLRFATGARAFAEGGIPTTINLNFSTPGAQFYKDFPAKMVR
jgi:hypothetical protein